MKNKKIDKDVVLRNIHIWELEKKREPLKEHSHTGESGYVITTTKEKEILEKTGVIISMVS